MASRDMIGSKVDGLEESRRALEKIIRAEMAAIPGALELIGQQLTTEVKRRAPVATGTLRRSYNWETGTEGRDAWVEVGSNVAYAAYQEFSTSRQGGRRTCGPPSTPSVRRSGRSSPSTSAVAAPGRSAGSAADSPGSHVPSQGWPEEERHYDDDRTP